MPLVVIKSGELRADGREETLTEYQCDWPGCANVAEHVLGVIKDIGIMAAICSEHHELHLRRSGK